MSLKTLKPPLPKKVGKQDRERKVLFGLIEYYLQTGKAVGSNTLKEAGFEDLSSATIRNYFAHLEEEGYLIQQHSSGGRIPTNQAFRLYADEFLYFTQPLSPSQTKVFKTLRDSETKEIAIYLQEVAETLSQLTQLAVFFSAPRFDQDFIVDLKLISIDHARCLCVIVTDFGVIQTEVIHVDQKVNSFSAKRIESYFQWRLSGRHEPENLTPEEELLAHKIYNEAMLRYIVTYSHFSDEEIYRTGFSKLLAYPDFQGITTLTQSLALFENAHSMRLLLKECSKHQQLKVWIGEDLAPYASSVPDCAVIAIPYQINQQSVGAIGMLGPVRIPYRELFNLLRECSASMAFALTKNIYKFKIHFRQPQPRTLTMQNESVRKLSHSHPILLEDKRK